MSVACERSIIPLIHMSLFEDHQQGHASRGPLTHDPQPSKVPAEGRRTADFVKLLFEALQSAGVRYCVLHGWDGLPEVLPSDLDLAVHPEDKRKLPAILARMQECGFLLVDSHNYEVNAHSFYFCWFDLSDRRCVVLDIAFEYRADGMLILKADELLNGRRRLGSFWIPDPRVRLRYLLAKRTVKRQFSPLHQEGISRVTIEVGNESSVEIAARLFGKDLGRRVISAVLQGNMASLSSELSKAMVLNSIRREPLTVLRCLAGECLRLWRRVMQPTGIVLAILGPDGAGKSTVIQDMMEREWQEFQFRRVFHWRPQLIGKRPDMGPLTDPHGTPARGTLGSLVRLAGFVVDYWIGYFFLVRPRLVRSGLVIFDRYFDDITVDCKRYRYGGPDWIPRLLVRLVPRPDLLVVLDADVEQMLSRKQEVNREELTKLRVRYAELVRHEQNAVVIRTDSTIAVTSIAIRRALAGLMSNRFRRRFPEWRVESESSARPGFTGRDPQVARRAAE